MELVAFDNLTARITARLQEKGPTTCKALASDLIEPEPHVRFALEMLRDGKRKFVEHYGGDMWALTDEYRKKNPRHP